MEFYRRRVDVIAIYVQCSQRCVHDSVGRFEGSGFPEVRVSIDKLPLVALDDSEVQSGFKVIGPDSNGFLEQRNCQIFAASSLIQHAKRIVYFEVFAVSCEDITKHACRLLILTGFLIPLGAPDFFVAVSNLVRPRRSGTHRWFPVRPRPRLLQLAGQLDERRIVAISAKQLHTDRQIVFVPVQRQ